MTGRLSLAWLAVAGALLVSRPSQAATFSAAPVTDAHDSAPGDGTCADATGACPLRAAIEEANALPGADVVTLENGIHRLALDAATGLVVTGDVEIVGSSVAAVTVSRAGGPAAVGEHVVVLAGVSVAFRHVTIFGLGGDSRCCAFGAIRSAGSLTLDDVIMRSNTLSDGSGTNGGAAVHVLGGSLTASRSTFIDNLTGDVGACLRVDSGAVTMTDCRVEYSRTQIVRAQGTFLAQYGGSVVARRTAFATLTPGPMVSLVGGAATFEDVTIDACGSSGATFLQMGGDLTVRRAAIRQSGANGLFSVSGALGRLVVEDATIEDGREVLRVLGGTADFLRVRVGGSLSLAGEPAVQVSSGAARLERLVVDATVADGDLAQVDGGSIELVDSELANGRESAMVDVVGGTAILDGCTIRGGRHAGPGGSVGVRVRADATVTNCTIVDQDGAGVSVSAGAARLVHCTVAANKNGGIVQVGGTMSIDHVIAAGSTVGGMPDDCDGTIDSIGHDVVQAASCTLVGGQGDVLGVDATLGPLGQQGGPTSTMVPLAGSPAIDGGIVAPCAAAVDQHGHARPLDGDGDLVDLCDVGAVEICDRAGLDADGDGVTDRCDACPATPDPRQGDCDSDGVGDACDPGDADGDGIADDIDDCPCLFQTSPADADSDGVGDGCDNCPGVPNADQADGDQDGVGDACAAPCPEPSALDRSPSAEPLLVEKSLVGEVVLRWEDVSAAEYEIFRGTLASLRVSRVYDHVRAACGIVGATAPVLIGAVDEYYLVGARCGPRRSSLGRDSRGTERPRPPIECP